MNRQKRFEKFRHGRLQTRRSRMPEQFEARYHDGNAISDSLYRQAVGSRIYFVICTRPDLCFVVSRQSPYMENPRRALRTCIKRVLRYIAGTLTLGVIFNSQKAKCFGQIRLCDSVWSGSKADRMSTTAFLFLHAGRSFSSKSCFLEVQKAICRDEVHR